MQTFVIKEADLPNIAQNGLSTMEIGTQFNHHGLWLEFTKAAGAAMSQAEIETDVEYVTISVKKRGGPNVFLLRKIPPAAIFDILTEFPYTRIMHGLSLRQGLNFKDFSHHYGFDFKESRHYEEILNIAQKTNLINVSDESISISDKNRNIVYIKYLIQALRKSISNKQHYSQISN